MQINVVIDLPDSMFNDVVQAAARAKGRLSRQDAAKLVHLSATRFSSEFKRTFGMTFRAFQLGVRLKIGAHLLSDTSLRVSEIAERLGYSDIGKFEKAFKRRFHVAPSGYRKDYSSHRPIAISADSLKA